MGSTMRSAKMNAVTPAKLMPPFHSTAASGTLPIEHKNEITATNGHPEGNREWITRLLDAGVWGLPQSSTSWSTTPASATGMPPLGFRGSPDDVANVAVFLAAAESDYVNGHTPVVDGGWVAH